MTRGCCGAWGHRPGRQARPRSPAAGPREALTIPEVGRQGSIQGMLQDSVIRVGLGWVSVGIQVWGWDLDAFEQQCLWN